MTTDERELVPLPGVREHNEGLDVVIERGPSTNGRWVIRARNEGGHNSTLVDFGDLMGFLFGPFDAASLDSWVRDLAQPGASGKEEDA